MASSPAPMLDKCAICLDPLGTQGLAVLPCSHLFHEECIQLCLRSADQQCPVCRRDTKPAQIRPLLLEYAIENENPCFCNMSAIIQQENPDKMRQVVLELIRLINEGSDEIVLRALPILECIAQKDKELVLSRPLVENRRVVEALLKSLWTHKQNKKVILYALRVLILISNNKPTGPELFVQTLSVCGLTISLWTAHLQGLLHCIGIQENSCFKYAFILLHNLMIDPHIGWTVIGYMCKIRVLTDVLDWLSDTNERFLNIVIDILKLLVKWNDEQMAFFLEMNGHQKLINILASRQQEALLYRTAKLLYRLAPMGAAKLVSAGLSEAVRKHLGHSSLRLLHQLLGCVRAVSNVRSTGHEIQPLLETLVQLLGTEDTPGTFRMTVRGGGSDASS